MLRDINLRWPENNTAPEWFWRHGSAEYLFYKALRTLKLNTPGIVKINVVCASHDQWDGQIFDGVTTVHVAAHWQDPQTLPVQALNQFFLTLMKRGVAVLCEALKVPATGLDAIEQDVAERLPNYAIPLGKKAVPLSAGGGSLRLMVQPSASLDFCRVVSVLTQGRRVVHEQDICTTYPNPEIAIDNFVSLVIESGTRAQAIFRTAGQPDQRVFGRLNFDASECPGVTRTVLDQAGPGFAQNLAFDWDAGG